MLETEARQSVRISYTYSNLKLDKFRKREWQFIDSGEGRTACQIIPLHCQILHLLFSPKILFLKFLHVITCRSISFIVNELYGYSTNYSSICCHLLMSSVDDNEVAPIFHLLSTMLQRAILSCFFGAYLGYIPKGRIVHTFSCTKLDFAKQTPESLNQLRKFLFHFHPFNNRYYQIV